MYIYISKWHLLALKSLKLFIILLRQMQPIQMQHLFKLIMSLCQDYLIVLNTLVNNV